MKLKPNASLKSQCALVAASCAGGNLRRATRAITQFYAKILEPCGLEPTQFTMLTACSLAEAAPISALAEALVIDRTTLTRNFQLLEKQGFIKIARGTDRRERIVSLSLEGQSVLAKALPLWKKAQALVLAKMGQSRLDNLLKDLAAVVELSRA